MAALDMDNREAFYARLMAARRGDPIEETLARLLASRRYGYGALPAGLGLPPAEFEQMLARHFPGIPPGKIAPLAETGGSHADRAEEMADLRKLLLENRTGRSESERWLVDILLAGCLGNDHLWQDLGLWSRADLSRLMREHFAPLAARNTRDMKWKKFLYKQLCQAEGIYTCRAPSCEVCSDYEHCFGPE